MKELSIEEKAKRYDEVVAMAQECITHIPDEAVNKYMLNMFPELKEPEDEKLRKEMLQIVKESEDSFYMVLTPNKRETLIALLEKQGKETSPQANERAWLYLVSDVLTWKDGIGQYLDDSRVQGLAKKLSKEYSGKLFVKEQGEQKSNWSEEDEKKRTLLIRILEVNHPNGYFKVNPANTSNMEAIHTEELVSWLKSLRPQNKWIPSKKQSEQKVAVFIPKFRVGDKLVSTKNPRLTYEVLEVGHINELGNPEYKVEIFTDGKVSNPHNIHYMECYKVDEWAKLIE